MRRFFSTIMLYAVILIGFSWVYHNNDNARAAVNRIAYVAQANFQQLKSRVTGQKATTTTSAKTQQTSSDSDSVSGRWKKTTATVYVSYKNQTLQQAALDAIAKWNATGSFIVFSFPPILPCSACAALSYSLLLFALQKSTRPDRRHNG